MVLLATLMLGTPLLLLPIAEADPLLPLVGGVVPNVLMLLLLPLLPLLPTGLTGVPTLPPIEPVLLPLLLLLLLLPPWLRNGMREETAPAATAATADTPDSFGGIWGLLGGIGGGTPRPPTGGIIVFLMVAVEPVVAPGGCIPVPTADAPPPPPITVAAAIPTALRTPALAICVDGRFEGPPENVGFEVKVMCRKQVRC